MRHITQVAKQREIPSPAFTFVPSGLLRELADYVFAQIIRILKGGPSLTIPG